MVVCSDPTLIVHSDQGKKIFDPKIRFTDVHYNPFDTSLYCCEYGTGNIFVFHEDKLALKKEIKGPQYPKKLCFKEGGDVYILCNSIFNVNGTTLYHMLAYDEYKFKKLEIKDAYDFVIAGEKLFTTIDALYVYNIT